MSDQIKRLNIADEKFSKKKLLGFSMVRLGNILSGLMLGEITYFATNSLGIAAAAISIGLAIKTAIDAVTDLLMGAIVDRTHTKYGKARPWVLAGIPMWIAVILIFLSPRAAMSDMGLVVYITILATFASAVFGTMCNIAYETHIKRSIVNNENRVRTLTFIGLIYAIGSMGLQIALPVLINIFHGSQKGFIILAVIAGVIGIVACLLAFMLCEEYSEEELAAFEGYEPEKQKEKVPIGVFLKSLLKNKYLIQFTLINFMYMIILMSSFTVGQYYFQYIYGNLSTFSIVMAASAVLFPVFAFIPKLAKKFGSAQLLSAAMLMAAGGVVLRLIIPKSIIAQMIGYLLVSLPNIINACVLSQINYEIMEYGRYKSGIVAEGMYSAFISFAQKMATSLNSVIVGVILTGTGFDFLTKAVKENGFTDWGELAALGEAGFEKYVTGGVDAVNHALSGINFAYNWLPLIFLIISIILLFFFHLERDLKALRVENGFNEDGTLAEKED
mgnify:CR=1 FL=1